MLVYFFPFLMISFRDCIWDSVISRRFDSNTRFTFVKKFSPEFISRSTSKSAQLTLSLLADSGWKVWKCSNRFSFVYRWFIFIIQAASNDAATFRIVDAFCRLQNTAMISFVWDEYFISFIFRKCRKYIFCAA